VEQKFHEILLDTIDVLVLACETEFWKWLFRKLTVHIRNFHAKEASEREFRNKSFQYESRWSNNYHCDHRPTTVSQESHGIHAAQIIIIYQATEQDRSKQSDTYVSACIMTASHHSTAGISSVFYNVITPVQWLALVSANVCILW